MASFIKFGGPQGGRVLMRWGLLFTCLASIATPLQAQLARQTLPSDAYFNGFRLYYEGDYQRAADVFQTASRLGLQTVEGRWVDGVCYHTMMGECLYRLGQLDQALEQYETAIRTFLRHRNWMQRVQFPNEIARESSRPRDFIQWAQRDSLLGSYGTYQVLFGDLDAGRTLETGGVFASPELRPVHVSEIMRCLAVSIRRRTELLGPIVSSESQTSTLLAALESPLLPPNHWAQAWVDVPRGMVLSAVGRIDEAREAWSRAVLLQGRYDHPLTALALVELGRSAATSGQVQSATDLLLQGAAVAASFEQVDLVGECFDQLHELQLQGKLTETHPAFAEGIAWANRSRYRLLRSQLLLNVTEQLLAMDQTAAAAEAFAEATKGQGRRPRISMQLAAQQSVLEAILRFREGKQELGERAFQQALQLQNESSCWLYQIGLANRLYREGSERLTPRSMSRLYEILLREPLAIDWQRRPLDSIVFLATPLNDAYENWFELAMQRDDQSDAIDVIQQMQRHRFFNSLPLGGRLLSLRWILEAPDDLLDARGKTRRDELLVRYPAYAQVSREARGVLDELRQIAPVDMEPTVAAKRRELTDRISELAEIQERMLAEIALSREPVPMAFPPQLSVKDVKSQLNSAQLIWGFSNQSRGLYAYMLSTRYVAVWKVERPKAVGHLVGELLKQIGMRGANQPIAFSQLTDTRWREPATELLDTLLEPSQRGFWNRFEELILIPDSVLWYCPIEALVADDEVLINRVRVRYAPLLALAVPHPGQHAALGPRPTITALGQLFPRASDDVTQDHFQQMEQVVDRLTVLPANIGVPTGLLRVLWYRLLVLDDIADVEEGPLAWSPGRIDAGEPGSALGEWLRLPWGGPAQVLLPGFHTAAETGAVSGDGNEIFTTVMGLMATGTRTVLLARWRTGGETSYNLMGEWLQECDLTSASQAWQRAVQVVRDGELDPSWEPRVTVRPEDPVIKSDHPFFWAGYILVDTGVGTPEPLPRRPSPTDATTANK